ncbi:MAG TPA: HPr family phosphocarrier protein [Candidatus Dormibacteraeota bacterium]|jgi:phosphotransferase system HPr (HPr) family protein|nr:HPr family phosphocarrier protein [Candidatus Dormibacteraeota bacterium]
MSRARAELAVEHEHGLHLRPAADFVRLAARYRAEVRVGNLTRGGDRRANAKSLLELTALGVDRGHRILLEAEGEDAEEAVAALRRLVESGFEAGR